MRKKYTKPAIVFESFSMSTNLAGSCEFDVNFAMDICPVEMSSGETVFTAEMATCMYTPQMFNQGPDMWNGFCYHIPVDTQNIFGS